MRGVRRDVLNVLGTHPRTVYLDLAEHELAQRTGGTSFTPSVQCLYALDTAIDELLEAGGWVARQQHYRQLAQAVRNRLCNLGINPVLPEGASSCVLQAFYLPQNVTYARLHDDLKDLGVARLADR